MLIVIIINFNNRGQEGPISQVDRDDVSNLIQSLHEFKRPYTRSLSDSDS